MGYLKKAIEKAIEGGYSIDEMGNVYSQKRAGTKGGLVKQWFDKYGYPQVRLHLKSGITNKHVHRLLALAFIPNPKKLPQVNHIDGNKKNYRLSNLEWCSLSENQQHAYRTGLKKVRSESKQKNIYKDFQTGKWRVIVTDKNGKKVHLGRYKNLNEAISIRDKFIDHLASGADPESFFKSLLTNHK